MSLGGESSAPRDSKSGPFWPEFGVPYTRCRDFGRAGFMVSFRRTSELVFKMTHGMAAYNRNVSAQNPQNPGILYLLYLLILLALQIPIGIWWVIDRLLFSTTIWVSPDWVRVGRRYIPRGKFGGFLIDHSLLGGHTRVAVLGYAYRNRRYAFGGVWPVSKAEEVASALNNLLRLVPYAGDRDRPSPQDLRDARPTQF
jgi:hypothetical protein